MCGTRFDFLHQHARTRTHHTRPTQNAVSREPFFSAYLDRHTVTLKKYGALTHLENVDGVVVAPKARFGRHKAGSFPGLRQGAVVHERPNAAWVGQHR